jgi:predicted AAA+ superfamily ATPase
MKDVIKRIIIESQDKKLVKIQPREIEIPINTNLIISLIGPRRSGKTYLLHSVYQQLIEKGINRNQLIYINFEDERLTMQTEDLDLILQSYLELYPENLLENCYFFFDEIQNIDGWEKIIRRVFDNLCKNVFVTGSNAKLLSTEIATSLRGRTITYTVLPLSLKEYLKFKKVDVSLFNTQKKAVLLNHIKDFILNGGFPEVIDFEKDTRLRVLQSYFNTMIYRDIIERYKISDPLILKYFIKKMFAGIGKPMSINKIYNDLRSQGYKVSNNILYNFDDYCKTIFLTVSIPKFDFSEIKQAKSEKKTYSIDTGLLASIEFSFSENLGKLFENAILLEFLKQGREIYYFMDKVECDFIVNENNNLFPFQVCYNLDNNETKEREIKGLVAACNKLSIEEGTIITFDQKEELIYKGIKIKILPMYEYFL